MRHLLLVLAACGGGGSDASIDSGPQRACSITTTETCMAATSHADLAWIEANVFVPSCAFSGCHNGTATVAGRLNLKDPGASHADLVGVDSEVAPGRKLVVAGAPRQSYLLLMLQAFPPGEMEPTPVAPPPATIGFMPMNTGGAVLCCQKLDAVERWISAGAQP